MSHNHMIISLGGTGGFAMKAFRKMLQEKHDSLNTVTLNHAQTTNFDYIYIDSSQIDINTSRQWKTIEGAAGANIGLGRNNLIDLSAITLTDRLNNLHDFNITKQYIGNPNLWADIRTNINLNNGTSGQVRRIGAAILEPKIRTIQERIQAGVNQLEQANNTQGVHFHVFAGIAGGTGSGTFLHIIAQLRALYAYAFAGGTYDISLYITLPKLQDVERGKFQNYYPNAYAALEELNAYLSFNGNGDALFIPFDLSGNSKKFEILANRVGTLTDRLQACYMVSCENNIGYNLSIEDLPLLLAQFLYQRTLVINHLPQQYHNFSQAVNFENGNLEQNRYRDFKAFGIKKIFIPSEEIKNHFTSYFIQQSLLQILYNHKSTDNIYIAFERPNFDYKDKVKNLVNEWKISDDHLKLNIGILESEENRQWTSQAEFWQLTRTGVGKSLLEQPINLKLLNEAEIRFEKQYKEIFRDVGVRTFFENKKSELIQYHSHTKEILYRVNEYLMSEWKEARLSLIEIENIIKSLLNYTEEKINTFGEKEEEINKKLKDIEDKIVSNRDSFNNIKLRDRLVGNPRVRHFNIHLDLLEEKYRNKTYISALGYANKLLKDLKNLIHTDLIHSIVLIKNNTLSRIDALANAINEDLTEKQPENNIKLYDKAAIQHALHDILSDSDNQKIWHTNLRNALLDKINYLGELNKYNNISFKNWALLQDNTEIQNLIRTISVNNVQTAHNGYSYNHLPLYNINILDKIKEKYGNGENLAKFIDDLVRTAQPLASFSQNEFDNNIAPPSLITISIPDYPQDPEFRQIIETCFINSIPVGIQAFIINSVDLLEEISIISLKHAFPLRYLSVMHNYKASYTQRMQSNPVQASLQLYIEDHYRALPKILKPNYAELEEQVIKLYSLTAGMNKFILQHNQATGEDEVYVNYRPNIPRHYPAIIYNFLIRNDLNNPLSEQILKNTITHIDLQDIKILEDYVFEQLADDHYRTALNRASLREALERQIDNITQNQQNYQRDPILTRFRLYITSARDSIENICRSNYL